MNKELIEALNLLEKEKNISKATLLEAIDNSLTQFLFPSKMKYCFHFHKK